MIRQCLGQSHHWKHVTGRGMTLGISHTLDRSPGGLTSNFFHATCHVGWKLKIEKIEGYEDRSESWIILDISTCLDPFNLKRDREKRPTGTTRISQVLASWPQRPQPSIRGHIPHTLTIQEME